MRRQPCEAAVPIDQSCGVPWKPTAGADVPIQRVPSGLPGPGGIGSRPFAQGELGGIHVGFLYISMISYCPSASGSAGWPMATGYVAIFLPSR